jgi:hypothetical protein
MSVTRHHRASRDAQIVFILPFEGGSPKEAREVKPPRYPSDRREPSRPRTTPPNRKIEAPRRWREDIRRRDEVARSMMRPNASLLKAWLASANF